MWPNPGSGERQVGADEGLSDRRWLGSEHVRRETYRRYDSCTQRFHWSTSETSCCSRAFNVMSVLCALFAVSIIIKCVMLLIRVLYAQRRLTGARIGADTNMHLSLMLGL